MYNGITVRVNVARVLVQCIYTAEMSLGINEELYHVRHQNILVDIKGKLVLILRVTSLMYRCCIMENTLRAGLGLI